MQIYPLSLGFVQAYLIKSESVLVLVDAGMPHTEKNILRKIHQVGGDLRLIFITHAHLDHYGSAAVLKQQTGALVAVHHADASEMALGKSSIANTRGSGKLMRWMLPLFQRMMQPQPCKADILLEGGEDLTQYGVAARVIHTPGHSPGSCSLLTEDEIAFVGDLLTVSRGKAHLQRFNAQNWAQVRESAKILADLGVEKCYTGHGKRAITREELKRLVEEG